MLIQKLSFILIILFVLLLILASVAVFTFKVKYVALN